MEPTFLNTQDLAKLQRALALAELAIENPSGYSSDVGAIPFELLIARFGHVKVQMYRERGPHKLPHFHIEYKKQYRASYAIESLDRIVGYMPKPYERPILDWARSMQKPLLACWEQLCGDGTVLKLQIEPQVAQSGLG